MESLICPYAGQFSTILVFGPPGVGKGALGRFLASAGSQYHLSSGDMFYGLAPSSAAGKLYDSCASRGQLLPDKAAIEIWKSYVQGLIATYAYYPESQDLLLDGIPRTRNQAEMLAAYIDVRHIIVLDLLDATELMRRMQHRARREGRIDDVNEEVMQRRIAVYQEQISSILDFYPKHLISRIDGGQKPLEVLRDVLVRLSHLLSRRT